MKRCFVIIHTSVKEKKKKKHSLPLPRLCSLNSPKYISYVCLSGMEIIMFQQLCVMLEIVYSWTSCKKSQGHVLPSHVPLVEARRLNLFHSLLIYDFYIRGFLSCSVFASILPSVVILYEQLLCVLQSPCVLLLVWLPVFVFVPGYSFSFQYLFTRDLYYEAGYWLNQVTFGLIQGFLCCLLKNHWLKVCQ